MELGHATIHKRIQHFNFTVPDAIFMPSGASRQAMFDVKRAGARSSRPVWSKTMGDHRHPIVVMCVRDAAPLRHKRPLERKFGLGWLKLKLKLALALAARIAYTDSVQPYMRPHKPLRGFHCSSHRQTDR